MGGDANIYPEVYQAWKAAGRDENIQMVGILPELKIWSVGFGGKKNAERACKLAMALAMCEQDPECAQRLIGEYPLFRNIMANARAPEQAPAVGCGNVNALFRSRILGRAAPY